MLLLINTHTFAELTQNLWRTAGFVFVACCVFSTGRPLCLLHVFIHLLSRDTHLLWLLRCHPHKGEGDWLHTWRAVRVICRPRHVWNNRRHPGLRLIEILTDGLFGMQIDMHSVLTQKRKKDSWSNSDCHLFTLKKTPHLLSLEENNWIWTWCQNRVSLDTTTFTRCVFTQVFLLHISLNLRPH